MGSVTMHEHIKYLLFRHNCLILPGFGGIVLQYSPARIHPAQHIFQPPRKALAFNRSLTTNDGLLITHVANAENLHYDEAEKRVRRFVEQIDESLRRKGDYALTGVGRFYHDIESNLRFEPDESENYLLNAYGLDRFVSPAIVRRDAFEPNPADTKKKKRRFNWFGFSSLVLVLILLAVQFLSMNNLSHIVTTPLAGIQLLTPLGNSADTNEMQPGRATGKRDTVVQIIVIKEEGRDDETYTTTRTAEKAGPMESTTPEPARLSSATATNASEHSAASLSGLSTRVDTRTADEKNTDSLRLIASSKVPMRGEYNPGELGRFVIVFSNSTDSTKAAFFQRQLWRDRIGAQVLPYRNRLLVAKPGYYTARAAAKDLTIYRMLGYDSAYILKMKDEQANPEATQIR